LVRCQIPIDRLVDAVADVRVQNLRADVVKMLEPAAGRADADNPYLQTGHCLFGLLGGAPAYTLFGGSRVGPPSPVAGPGGG
jgi:hypothetical protein